MTFSPVAVLPSGAEWTCMTIENVRVPRSTARPIDRTEAGRSLRPLLRRACGAAPVLVGVGVGGLAVAAAAREPGSPLGLIVVEEFALPDPLRPGTASGAVGSGGRTLLRGPALDRLLSDADRLRRTVHDARVGLTTAPLPAGYTGPDVDGREVVLVDDGTSSCTRLAAAVDFVRRGRPQRVVLAVACAPRERITELEDLVGDVVVAGVPAWADWFHRHGHLYESDHVPSPAEVRQLLSP